MIMLFAFMFFVLYLFYLHKWTRSCLAKEYSFGSPSPPKPLPHSPIASALVGVAWGVTLITGIFWGFTYNRYPAYLSLKNADTETFLLIVISTALGLSYAIVYRLGELRGIASMKSTELFRGWRGET